MTTFRAIGADRISTVGAFVPFSLMMFISGLIVAKAQIIGIAALFVLPLLAVYLFYVFRFPAIGFITLLLYAFLGIGLGRYATSLMGGSVLGLGIDFLLLLLLLIALLARKIDQKDFSLLRSPSVLFTIAWFGINLLQIFNPLSPGIEAWFYAGRGVSFYMLFTIPLAILLFNKEKDLVRFLNLWIFLSVIGTLWGIKQKFIGLDGAELMWLNDGNLKTHMLFGNLRVFSFFTDAGQFGAAQGHAAISAIVLAFGPYSKRARALYGIAGLLCFYGLIISGTRGALAVPVIGAIVYLVLSKNWKVLSIGIMIVVTGYVFLKFTSIGQDNYDIRRLRTALDPNDASFQTRLDNQALLAGFLNRYPFGGGVGAGGYWGLRFKPDSFLANLPLDSWYVRIAADYGWVGLAFYLVMIFYFLISGFYTVFRCSDPARRQRLASIYAGMVGIAVASYGNQVWGQMPTGIIIYVSIAFLEVARKKWSATVSSPSDSAA